MADPFLKYQVVQVPLEGLDDFGRTRMFNFIRDGEDLMAFVVRQKDGSLSAFVNRCPHVPYTLDFGDGRVFDDHLQEFICSSHGARFRPQDGVCFAGPVVGRRLEPLPIRLTPSAQFAEVAITPEPEGWPNAPY